MSSAPRLRRWKPLLLTAAVLLTSVAFLTTWSVMPAMQMTRPTALTAEMSVLSMMMARPRLRTSLTIPATLSVRPLV